MTRSNAWRIVSLVSRFHCRRAAGIASPRFGWLLSKSLLAAVVAIAGNDAAHAELLEQSPINIMTVDVARDPNFKNITFNYSASSDLTVMNINSGDVEGTFRGIPTGASTSTISYDSVTYNLLQFHFHVESEHLINR